LWFSRKPFSHLVVFRPSSSNPVDAAVGNGGCFCAVRAALNNGEKD
jgi:hypothetical protein